MIMWHVGLDRFCTDCRATISSALPISSQEPSGYSKHKKKPKRTSDSLSPNAPLPPCLDPNKSRFSASSNDFSEFLKDLDVSDREELIARALSAPPLASTLKSTEEAYNSFKIAFADEAFRSFTARSLSTTSNGSSASPPESSTLVVTVNKASNEEVKANLKHSQKKTL